MKVNLNQTIALLFAGSIFLACGGCSGHQSANEPEVWGADVPDPQAALDDPTVEFQWDGSFRAADTGHRMASVENESSDAEIVKCLVQGNCATLPSNPHFVLRVVIDKVLPGDRSSQIHIKIPSEKRPDCDKSIGRVGILVDTAGLSYDLNSCYPSPVECMDYIRWELVEKWAVWEENGKNLVSTAGKCDGCEQKHWAVGSRGPGKVAMNSLCAGDATIIIQPGSQSTYELHSIYFLVWYE